MRIFYALTFTNEDKSQIEEYGQLVKKHCEKGNFSRTENYHITLQFIGQINPAELNEYKDVLKELKTHPKSLELIQFGTFEKKNKKIVWLGIKRNKELETLHHEVINTTRKFGIQLNSEKYIPHITLARQVVGLEMIDPIMHEA